MTKQEEQKKIEVLMEFPVPGKWTIETSKEQGFILTNECDASTTAYLNIDELREALSYV